MIYLQWTYFVSFLHSIGSGNGEYTLNKRISSAAVKKLEAEISERGKINGVTIMNWKLLGVKLKFK